jgi:hypothetical protein
MDAAFTSVIRVAMTFTKHTSQPTRLAGPVGFGVLGVDNDMRSIDQP